MEYSTIWTISAFSSGLGSCHKLVLSRPHYFQVIPSTPVWEPVICHLLLFVTCTFSHVTMVTLITTSILSITEIFLAVGPLPIPCHGYLLHRTQLYEPAKISMTVSTTSAGFGVSSTISDTARCSLLAPTTFRFIPSVGKTYNLTTHLKRDPFSSPRPSWPLLEVMQGP